MHVAFKRVCQISAIEKRVGPDAVQPPSPAAGARRRRGSADSRGFPAAPAPPRAGRGPDARRTRAGRAPDEGQAWARRSKSPVAKRAAPVMMRPAPSRRRLSRRPGFGARGPCGGIGRRDRLKICFPQGSACSSQARGTSRAFRTGIMIDEDPVHPFGGPAEPVRCCLMQDLAPPFRCARVRCYALGFQIGGLTAST